MYEDHVDEIDFFQRSEWSTADDDEDPQAASVNEEERDVLPSESFYHCASLEGGNPQQLRKPAISKCLAKGVACLGLAFGLNTTSDLSKVWKSFHISCAIYRGQSGTNWTSPSSNSLSTSNRFHEKRT